MNSFKWACIKAYFTSGSWQVSEFTRLRVRSGLFYDGKLLGLLCQLALEAYVFYEKSFFHGAALL